MWKKCSSRGFLVCRVSPSQLCDSSYLSSSVSSERSKFTCEKSRFREENYRFSYKNLLSFSFRFFLFLCIDFPHTFFPLLLHTQFFRSRSGLTTAAYPIVIVYRCAFYHSISKAQTNLYFTLCGILICIFNYGFEVYHSLIAVTFTYAIINLLHKSRFLVPVSFTFHMGYLLIGKNLFVDLISTGACVFSSMTWFFILHRLL